MQFGQKTIGNKNNHLMLAVAYKQEDETTGKHYAFACAQRGKEREIQCKQKNKTYPRTGIESSLAARVTAR